MLLVGIGSYLTSVLTRTVLISGTYHPDRLYLREQGCEDPYLFFETKKSRRADNFGKH